MARALILEGGGAKGAYVFGWLLALKRSKIHFDVVCGTSVGALNGLLWSLGCLKEGRRFWQRLAPKHIRHRRFPVGAHYLLVAMHYFCNSCIERHERDKFWSVRGSIAQGANLMLVSSLALPVVILVGAVFGRELPEWRNWLVFPLLAVPYWTVYGIHRLCVRYNLTAFTTSPLRAAVSQFTEGRRLNTPLYVTTASRVAVAHPHHLVEGGCEMDTRITYYAPQWWLANYTRMSGSMDSSILTKEVMNSVSLPYSIFAPGEHSIDGGLADNVPVWPAVALERCDEVLVLRTHPVHERLRTELTPRVRETAKEGVWRYTCEIDEMQRASEIRMTDLVGVDRFGPPDHSLLNVCSLTRPSIEVFGPRRSLGGTLFGTLNFRSSYTRPLVIQGYRDARKHIAQLWKQPMSNDVGDAAC